MPDSPPGLRIVNRGSVPVTIEVVGVNSRTPSPPIPAGITGTAYGAFNLFDDAKIVFRDARTNQVLEERQLNQKYLDAHYANHAYTFEFPGQPQDKSRMW